MRKSPIIPMRFTARNDYAFKKLFGTAENKDIMIEFISLVSQLSKDDFDDVRIERVMDIFYLDEQERKRYEAAWEYESDRLSMINESERKGLERGLVEGEARGSHQAKVETARILKQLGDPVPKIMQATGLSEEEVEKINL
nr:PD-(D/E)XK nuclease family transposase [uncultured Treponema sp.]